MRRFIAAFIDLVCGALLLGLAFVCTRKLLHDPKLVYLLFPLLSAGAFGFARWRSRGGVGERLLTVVLLNLPLAGAFAAWLSARDRGLVALLAVTLAASLLGAAVQAWRVAASAWVVGNVLLAFAVPAFVGLLVNSAEVNQPAPRFVLHVVEAAATRAVPSADLKGRVVVLDFWATWCVPCRRELPEIGRLARTFAEARREVVFFAVDSALTDNPGDVGDTPEKARVALGEMGVELPLAFSGDGELEKALGIHGFPGLVVLDRAGRIRLRHVGYVEAENLTGKLTDLIARLEAEPRQ